MKVTRRQSFLGMIGAAVAAFFTRPDQGLAEEAVKVTDAAIQRNPYQKLEKRFGSGTSVRFVGRKTYEGTIEWISWDVQKPGDVILLNDWVSPDRTSPKDLINQEAHLVTGEPFVNEQGIGGIACEDISLDSFWGHMPTDARFRIHQELWQVHFGSLTIDLDELRTFNDGDHRNPYQAAGKLLPLIARLGELTPDEYVMLTEWVKHLDFSPGTTSMLVSSIYKLYKRGPERTAILNLMRREKGWKVRGYHYRTRKPVTYEIPPT